MAELLKGARRKVARAREHILALQTNTVSFFGGNPYQLIVEPDPNNSKYEIYKLRFDEGLPHSLENSTSDALHNLRDSLDNAGYALAVAGGKINPAYAAFPFAGSAAQFENSLGRSKDIPTEFHDIFRSCGPYKGGNDVLWALGQLAVTDKHKLLMISLNSQLGNVIGEGAIRRIPVNPSWDSTKKEIELFTGAVGHPLKIDMEFGLFTFFADVPLLATEPALKVLDYFVEIVEHIFSTIEAEAQRLGFVT
jgi:hypothetical protein